MERSCCWPAANGSGKTTLLKVLAGLLAPQEARFKCLGVSMAGRTAARFCRGRHIYLHQTPFMFDGSVEENVSYGLRQRRRDGMQRRIEIRDALAWAQLEHLVHRRANELSVGEQQRVALTRARILAPSLLLLDEITANMDADSRKRTYEMIVDLRRAGSSIVFASQTITSRLRRFATFISSSITGVSSRPSPWNLRLCHCGEVARIRVSRDAVAS